MGNGQAGTDLGTACLQDHHRFPDLEGTQTGPSKPLGVNDAFYIYAKPRDAIVIDKGVDIILNSELDTFQR